MVHFVLYFWSISPSESIKDSFFSEQPIQLDPRTPTFVLGLEQVAALVEATGKIVGNKVTEKLSSDRLYPSTCLSCLLPFGFLPFLNLEDF